MILINVLSFFWPDFLLLNRFLANRPVLPSFLLPHHKYDRHNYYYSKDNAPHSNARNRPSTQLISILLLHLQPEHGAYRRNAPQLVRLRAGSDRLYGSILYGPSPQLI